jgi:hypothetical protein
MCGLSDFLEDSSTHHDKKNVINYLGGMIMEFKKIMKLMDHEVENLSELDLNLDRVFISNRDLITILKDSASKKNLTALYLIKRGLLYDEKRKSFKKFIKAIREEEDKKPDNFFNDALTLRK